MGILYLILSNIGASSPKSTFEVKMSSTIPAESVKVVSFGIFHTSAPTARTLNVNIPFLNTSTTIMRCAGKADGTTSDLYDSSQQNHNSLLFFLDRTAKDTIANSLDLDFTTSSYAIPSKFIVDVTDGDTGLPHTFEKLVVKLEYRVTRLF